MKISEKRFMEGSGQQFMSDGRTIRCQAVSTMKVERCRAERDDYTSPTEAFWPDAQCNKRAIPGLYVCRYHGGSAAIAKGYKPELNMLNTMPIDLAEKVQLLAKNPSYLSNRDEILLFQARVWQLLEQLENKEVGSEEAWEMVGLAIKKLRQGDTVSALHFLEQALETTTIEREVWREVRITVDGLSDLRATQTKTIKEMRMWASLEQVSNLITNIQQIITDAGEKFIGDDRERIQYLQYVGDRVYRLINFSPSGVGPKSLLSSGDND